VPCTDRCASGSSACPTPACSIPRTTTEGRGSPASAKSAGSIRVSAGEIGEADVQRLHEESAAGASEQDGCRRAGQSQNAAGLRPTPTSPRTRTGPPLKCTFAGIWEIDPHGLEEHVEADQILDVREPGEFDGPLGHIRGASS
jgi:hypothetical protein